MAKLIELLAAADVHAHETEDLLSADSCSGHAHHAKLVELIRLMGQELIPLITRLLAINERLLILAEENVQANVLGAAQTSLLQGNCNYEYELREKVNRQLREFLNNRT